MGIWCTNTPTLIKMMTDGFICLLLTLGAGDLFFCNDLFPKEQRQTYGPVAKVQKERFEIAARFFESLAMT